MPNRFHSIILILFILGSLVACTNNRSTDQSTDKLETQREFDDREKVGLTISAAASLKDAMEVIQHSYQEKHPEVELTFNFGGSGSLQQQISNGAPVDLFLSADKEKFTRLVEEGIIAKTEGTDLLGNKLVLIVSKEKQSSLSSFQDLTKEEIDTISLGTPETVPAGKYAKELLEQIHIWKKINSKVVFAKDVRQVLSYVETGNIDAGIVYKTDAMISDKVKIVATADPSTHTPIIYPIGIIKGTKHYEDAKRFYNYLQSKESMRVFKDYGFTIK
jgi:molybdate transport system substrate-binding protein